MLNGNWWQFQSSTFFFILIDRVHDMILISRLIWWLFFFFWGGENWVISFLFMRGSGDKLLRNHEKHFKVDCSSIYCSSSGLHPFRFSIFVHKFYTLFVGVIFLFFNSWAVFSSGSIAFFIFIFPLLCFVLWSGAIMVNVRGLWPSYNLSTWFT